MDLSELDDLTTKQDDGVFIDVVVGMEMTDFRICVCGPDSERARQSSRDVANASIKRGNLLRHPTAAMIEADRIREIAGCIKAWEGLTHYGEPIPFTNARAIELLTKYRSIFDQVERAARSRSIYYRGFASPSVDTRTFDLKELDDLNQRQNAGQWFDILDAYREPIGIRMKIVGPDSDAQQTARNAALQRLIGRGGDDRSAEDRQRDNIEILAACVLDWEGVTRNGEPVDCTPDEVASLLTRYPIVLDQVDAYSSARAFFGADNAREGTEDE